MLLNPEGIGAVLEDKDELVKGDIPIIGENNAPQTISLVQLRSGQKLAVKESLEEILKLVNEFYPQFNET